MNKSHDRSLRISRLSAMSSKWSRTREEDIQKVTGSTCGEHNTTYAVVKSPCHTLGNQQCCVCVSCTLIFKNDSHFVRLFSLWKTSNLGFEAIVFKLWQKRFVTIPRRIFLRAKFLFQSPSALTPHDCPFRDCLSCPSAVDTGCFSLWRFLYFCTDFKKPKKRKRDLGTWDRQTTENMKVSSVCFILCRYLLRTIKENNFLGFCCLKIGNDNQSSRNLKMPQAQKMMEVRQQIQLVLADLFLKWKWRGWAR